MPTPTSIRRPRATLRTVRRCRMLRTALAGLLLGGLFVVQGSGPLGAQPRNVVHEWTRLYYGSLDGQERLLFAERFGRAKPALGDLDGDGALDLLLGRANGTIMVFRNAGTAQQPDFRLTDAHLGARPAGTEQTSAPIDVGENAAPALVDLDGDGTLDLIVGNAAGRLALYRNEGNAFLPQFRLVAPDLLQADYGLNLVPRFVDIDGDGVRDLSVGNEAGHVFLVPNAGTRAEYRFCTAFEPRQDCLRPARELLRLERADNAVPAWVDWDGDGDPDLMVGKSDGTIDYYRNIGTPREGAWEREDERFNLLDIGAAAAPLFRDLNGDGKADLLLAGDSEQVAYYTRREGREGFQLWRETDNALRVAHLGDRHTRLRLASGDLNGDGQPELLVGTRTGELLLYVHTGKAGSLAYRSPQGSLLPSDARAFSAPALADLDGDGDLDLVVGNRGGRLELIENTGTPEQPAWTVRSLFFAEIDVGALSTPAFYDLDGDGDLDLVVGNSLGNVVLYENTGDAKRPAFTLRNVRFGGLALSAQAAPALFPWAKQGPPDLVVGNQRGTLVPAARNPDVQLVAEGGYRPEQPWAGLSADAFSAPDFTDVTGDGRPDLLLGTGAGAVLLWRLEASHERAQVAQAGQAPPGSNVVPGAEGTPAGSATAGTGQPGVATGEQAPGTLALDPLFQREASPLERIQVGSNTKPAFLDLDGDGRPDLLLGTAAGKLYHFRNSGDRKNPDWEQITDRFGGYQGGRNAAPAFYDIDGDGDRDLVVGDETGRVLLWPNTGSDRSPRFTQPAPEPLVVRSARNAVPALTDMDGDGRPDMVVGGLKGDLMYFRHTPAAQPTFRLELRTLPGIGVTVNASPVFADLTRQDTAYLLLGSDQGPVRVYAPTGTDKLRSSGWRDASAYLQGLEMPMGSHPTLVDLEGDGDLDLVVGSDAGPLRFFRNNAILHDEQPLAQR